jgi:hypothetical protein
MKGLPPADRGDVTPTGAEPGRRIGPTRPMSPMSDPARLYLSQTSRRMLPETCQIDVLAVENLAA